jgi:4-hydroxy-3-polyprenylbenzoate decarboxylase
VGVPPQEDAYIAEATERIFLAPIRLAIQPEVCDLWMPVEGTAHNLAVVSIDKRYGGQAHKVVQSLWGAGQMMFNKYMVVASSNVDVRSFENLASLLRRVDVGKSVIRGEGVLDVLDHATATCGFGGKLAIDLTDVDINSAVEPIEEPRAAKPAGGVRLFDTRFVESCGLLILYADQERPMEVDVEQYLKGNDIQGMKYVALFDYQASISMTANDLLWLAMANSDPRRDVKVLGGGELLLDARSKHPGVGENPKRFPNVVMSSVEIINHVDSRWAEYGLGDMLPSPSRRYRKLWLSPRAEW